jgi:hypothetical protein
MNDEEFYVGYFPKAPAGAGRFVQRAAVALMVLGVVCAVLLVVGEQPFAESSFEYQKYRAYEGEVVAWPYPMLLTAEGRYLLVAEGKHGAGAAVRALDGRRVALEGALIRRGADQMLEVRAGTVRDVGAARGGASVVDLGEVSLSGEIVDSKCYLGVMNPGNGKVHRDCAARCISGGIPPAFLARDGAGAPRVLLLTGLDSRALGREILDYVGEPVRIRGRLARVAAQLVLQAEPRDIRRE